MLYNEKGQSLVEFTIVLPIILLILMGILEFGIMLNCYLTLNNVSREGARLGIVGGSNAEIESLIKNTSPNLNHDRLTIIITPEEGSRKSGESLTVTLSYKYQVFLPIISSKIGDKIILKSQTSMRIE